MPIFPTFGNRSASIFTESPQVSDVLFGTRSPAVGISAHVSRIAKTSGTVYPWDDIDIPQKGKISLAPTTLIGGRAISLLKWLVMSHWRNVVHLDELAKIILHMKNITLSNLDWLCTNFSKTFDVRYPTDDNSPIEFSIHESYNERLEVHLRAFFDVFARNARILVEWVTEDRELFQHVRGQFADSESLDITWDNKKNVGGRMVQGRMMMYMITSVAQLNFFAWAMDHKVLEYCKEHVKEIEQHNDDIQNKPNPTTGKRRRLSQAPVSSLKVRKIKTLVHYADNVHVMTMKR